MILAETVVVTIWSPTPREVAFLVAGGVITIALVALFVVIMVRAVRESRETDGKG